MVILAVDPQPSDLEHLVQCLKCAYPQSRVLPFSDPLLAYQYGFNNAVDAVYTVKHMKRLDGMGLANMLRKKHPAIQVCFITGKTAKQSAVLLQFGRWIHKPITVQAILAPN